MFKMLRTLFGGQSRLESARHEAAEFRLLTEHNNDVIFRCGADGIAHYVSPSCLRIFGWKPEEMVGKGPDEFVMAEDMPAVIAAQARHLGPAEESASAVAFRIRRKDEALVWLEASARTVTNPDTGKHEIVIVMRDITERKQLEDQLAKLAMTDGLTGLANRRAFDAALDNEWLRTKRGNGQLSLLLIDLDHFKAFNDHYGHQVGDDCLRTVSSAIQLALRRPADLAARYGGEEIAVVLPETDTAGAIKVADDIRAAIALLRIPHAGNYANDGADDGAGIVTMSIGVATALSRVGASTQMPSGLLQAADMALYKAKNNGRNRVETALLLSGEGTASAA